MLPKEVYVTSAPYIEENDHTNNQNHTSQQLRQREALLQSLQDQPQLNQPAPISQPPTQNKTKQLSAKVRNPDGTTTLVILDEDEFPNFGSPISPRQSVFSNCPPYILRGALGLRWHKSTQLGSCYMFLPGGVDVPNICNLGLFATDFGDAYESVISSDEENEWLQQKYAEVVESDREKWAENPNDDKVIPDFMRLGLVRRTQDDNWIWRDVPITSAGPGFRCFEGDCRETPQGDGNCAYLRSYAPGWIADDCRIPQRTNSYGFVCEAKIGPNNGDGPTRPETPFPVTGFRRRADLSEVYRNKKLRGRDGMVELGEEVPNYSQPLQIPRQARNKNTDYRSIEQIRNYLNRGSY